MSGRPDLSGHASGYARPGRNNHPNYSISGTEDYTASLKDVDGGGYLPILHFLTLRSDRKIGDSKWRKLRGHQHAIREFRRLRSHESVSTIWGRL